MIRLSGSKSLGLVIVITEYPRLSKTENPVAEVKYVTWGVKETERPCGPLGKERSSLNCADQVPLPSNETCETVKELVSSSIENVRVGLSEFPSLSDNPDPLLDVRDPVMLKNSPEGGLRLWRLSPYLFENGQLLCSAH